MGQHVVLHCSALIGARIATKSGRRLDRRSSMDLWTTLSVMPVDCMENLSSAVQQVCEATPLGFFSQQVLTERWRCTEVHRVCLVLSSSWAFPLHPYRPLP